MKHRIFLKATVASCALLGATSVQADVTAAQVWDDWKTQIELTGIPFTATENMAGSVLTITDLTITPAFDEGSAVFVVPELTLTENGDGTVSVGTAAEFDGKVTATEEGKTIEVDLYARPVGLDLVVSGTPEKITYDYTLTSATMGIDDITGTQADDVRVTGTATLSNLSGQSVSTKAGDMITVDQNYTAESFGFDVAVSDPKAEEDGAFDGIIRNLSSTSTSTMSPGGAADPYAIVQGGGAASGNFGYDSGLVNFSGSDGKAPMSGVITVGKGTAAIDLGADGLRYNGTGGALDITVETAALPFPINVQMGESAMNLVMPILNNDSVQDFALGFALRDVTIADALWNMFDPAGMLPRTPATISAQFDGTGVLNAPVFDSSKSEEIEAQFMAGETPGDLHTLKLSDLEVSLAGAALTGTGDFTFDNTDTETFDGMPRPEGTLELQLVGINTLADTLVKMGLVPEEQVMGARMMMGMFTVVSGDDVLTSTVEINNEGHVLANGQRVR